MGKKSGFTLIELLVVVAIIAVLVAILLPALSKTRALGRALTCSTNLKTVGMGMMMYLNENNGIYPQDINIDGWQVSERYPRWWPAIGRFIGDDWGTWDGSNWPKKKPDPNAGAGTVGHCPNHVRPHLGGYSYRGNCFILKYAGGTPVSSDQIDQPSKKILVYEVFTDGWIPKVSHWGGGWGNWVDYGIIGAYDFLNTHIPNSNFLMCDLHVATAPLDMMTDFSTQWRP